MQSQGASDGVLAVFFCVSLKACPPLLRVLGAMKDGVANDGVSRRHVKNFTRKSPKEGAPELIHRDGIKMGMAFYGKDAGLNTTEKILPESGFLALIPVVRQRHILIGVARKNDTLNHVAPVLAA